MKSVAGMVLLCLLVFGSLSGCGGAGPARGRYALETTPPMVAEYRRAEHTYQVGHLQEALTLFDAYIDRYPYNRLTDQSRLRIGQIFLKLGKPQEALSPLDQVMRGVYDTELTPEALYYGMLAYHRLEQPERAWRVLQQVRWSATRASYRILLASFGIAIGNKLNRAADDFVPLYLEIVDAYIILSQPLRADESWLVSEGAASEWVRRWVEAAKGNRSFLQKLAKRFGGKSSGGFVLYKLAKLAYEQGKTEEARDYFEQYVRSYPKHEYVDKAQVRLAELGRKVDTGYISVGVLLPLSGRYGSYGKAVLRGIQCSAGVFQPCRSELPIRLVIRNSGSDPAKAAEAFADLVTNEYVAGVIGPLAQVEVGAVVTEAARHQIPLIAVSQKEGITEVSPYIFRNFLTIEDQVQTLARYVCDATLQEIAILCPSTTLGQIYKDIFTQELEKCNKTVKATASYDPATGNFQDGIRNLKFSIQKHKLGAEVGFEALFIPDSYKNLSKIIPLLSFLGIGQTQLLGAAGWDNEKLAQEHPEAMEGAIFVSGFYLRSAAGPTRRFADDFQHAFGSAPTFLEAYGYDSLELMQRALRGNRSASRRELRDALSRIDHFPGATGAITFDSHGDAKRHLFLLTVKDGEIREIE